MLTTRYKNGDRVSPIGQPDKFGTVIGHDPGGYPVVNWEPGVVSPGTENPISEAPGDLQPAMTPEEAIAIVREAADNWCDYLEEADRSEEIAPIETAIRMLKPLPRAEKARA